MEVEISKDIWHHIVLTVSPGNHSMSIYINGTSQDVRKFDLHIFGMAEDPPVLLIGKEHNSDASPAIKAVIDELVLWENVLNQEQVLQLYQAYQDET